jgi:hypothetical protein
MTDKEKGKKKISTGIIQKIIYEEIKLKNVQI